MSNNQYTLRMASVQDQLDLDRLAQLDSSTRLDGPALVAEVDGAAVAALDLIEGRIVADPFRPTLDAVELLETRARSLGREPQPSGWRTTGLRAALASSRRRTGVV